eukprot:654706-Rhodomonas_salina.1
MRGTERPVLTKRMVLSAYTRPMRCPVLTYVVLPEDTIFCRDCGDCFHTYCLQVCPYLWRLQLFMSTAMYGVCDLWSVLPFMLLSATLMLAMLTFALRAAIHGSSSTIYGGNDAVFGCKHVIHGCSTTSYGDSAAICGDSVSI